MCKDFANSYSHFQPARIASKELAGKADGKRINECVKTLLA